MTDKPFEELDLEEKTKVRLVDSNSNSSTCPSCGKPRGRGSMTSCIFQSERCHCKDIPAAATTNQEIAQNQTVLVAQDALELEPVAANMNEAKSELASTSPSAGLTETDEKTSNLNVNLGERYEVLERIGEGGAGQVYKVFDKELQLPFAVKLLRPEVSQDPVMKQRFLQESKLAITLTHENLVGMYGHNETPDGTPFIVMDYLEGRSLETIFKQDGRLSEERLVSIFTQVLEGLSHAHSKGLIHRDLKPANIIIVEKLPGVEVVKLIDFGIAKLTETSLRTTHNLTQTGEVFGTPAYMSPEQCLGFEVDARSDFYSLGCMMYEAVSGNPPFAGKNAVQIISKHLGADPFPLKSVSERLDELIMACLAKDVSDRPQSAEKLLAKLRQIEPGARKFPELFGINSRQVKNFFKSKNNNILPGMRLYYGSSGIAMWACFITAVLANGPSSGRISPEPLVHLVCSVLLFVLYFGLVSFRARVRQISQIVETSEPVTVELEAVRKKNLSAYSLFFKGEPRYESYTSDNPALENQALPILCKTWTDERGERVAVELDNSLLLKSILPYSITHIGWWKILIATWFVAIEMSGSRSSPAEFNLLFRIADSSFVLLILGGLVRSCTRKDWLLAAACLVSSVFVVLPRLFGLLHIPAPKLYLEYLGHPTAAATAAVCIITMWSVFGIVRLLEYSGLLKIKKSRRGIADKKIVPLPADK